MLAMLMLMLMQTVRMVMLVLMLAMTWMSSVAAAAAMMVEAAMTMTSHRGAYVHATLSRVPEWLASRPEPRSPSGLQATRGTQESKPIAHFRVV